MVSVQEKTPPSPPHPRGVHQVRWNPVQLPQARQHRCSLLGPLQRKLKAQTTKARRGSRDLNEPPGAHTPRLPKLPPSTLLEMSGRHIARPGRKNPRPTPPSILSTNDVCFRPRRLSPAFFCDFTKESPGLPRGESPGSHF